MCRVVHAVWLQVVVPNVAQHRSHLTPQVLSHQAASSQARARNLPCTHMAHLDFGEATFRTRLLPGCSEYLKHDPQIKLYGMREAPVHGQGSLEGHFAVIGLPTQDLPIARCFTAIAAHPSAECGAWSAHKDFRLVLLASPQGTEP